MRKLVLTRPGCLSSMEHGRTTLTAIRAVQRPTWLVRQVLRRQFAAEHVGQRHSDSSLHRQPQLHLTMATQGCPVIEKSVNGNVNGEADIAHPLTSFGSVKLHLVRRLALSPSRWSILRQPISCPQPPLPRCANHTPFA